MLSTGFITRYLGAPASPVHSMACVLWSDINFPSANRAEFFLHFKKKKRICPLVTALSGILLFLSLAVLVSEVVLVFP